MTFCAVGSSITSVYYSKVVPVMAVVKFQKSQTLFKRNEPSIYSARFR